MRLSSVLHTFKWFQVLLHNSHNLTSLICLCTVSSIWPINRTLSGATIPGQRGLGSNSNERGTPHSPNLQGCSLAIRWFNIISSIFVGGRGLTPLQRCRWCILQPSQLGWENSLIHTFPMDISTVWNANSLIQNLNLSHWAYFLQQWPLHNKYHHTFNNDCQLFRYDLPFQIFHNKNFTFFVAFK